jgi:hypothetical protein
MEKNTKVAILNTLAGAANVIDDTTAKHWSIVKDATDKEVILGPVDYGKTAKMEIFASQAEVRQHVVIGASTTKETIVASTRYAIVINEQEDYETQKQGDKVFAYTTAAALSGTAATDRATVYSALVDKINAYDGVNVTAYTLTYVAFTGGTSTGDAATNFIIGETVTQETSTETAKVAKCDITSGDMAGDDAAGNLWLYDISDVDSWLETAVDLTADGTDAGVSTNIVVTQTNATTVHNTGIVIVDDAGYFISKINRGGASLVFNRAGFSTDVPTISVAPQYARGIGSVMLAQKAIFDRGHRDVVQGDTEFLFEDNMEADASKVYSKYVFTIADGDELASTGEKITGHHQLIIYLDESNSGNLAALDGALDTVIAK